MTKIPVDTRTAFLPSEGYNGRKATKHIYSHSDLVKRGCGVVLGHYYRCLETGAIRLWGCDVTFAKDDGAN